MNYQKPNKLSKGDTVAIVSPSWGGPSVFPHIYENGLKVLEEWGLKVKEMPTARMSSAHLRANPKIRAKDINDAFADPEIKAIFSSIGGDDSIRILPFLDSKIIQDNPKIFIGYSDATTLHVFGNLLGLTTFYGPTIMAGFCQMNDLPPSYKAHVHDILFTAKESYQYQPYQEYCDGYADWSDIANTGKISQLKSDNGWHWLQGKTTVQGELFGGCMEVLEMLKATAYWPKQSFWQNKIFFLETSEEKPSINYIDHVLRNYGAIGVYSRISAFVVGRARDFNDEEKQELEAKILDIVKGEFSCDSLPIITNFEIGHTDPQLVLPLGTNAQIDCQKQTFKLIEPWLS